MDWAVGTIVVSICIGVIHGSVYGWLFFGVICMITYVAEKIVGGCK